MNVQSVLRTATISIVPRKDEEGFGEKYLRIVERFKAQPVAADEAFRGDPMVVLSNVRRGLHALDPHQDLLRTDTSVAWDEVMVTDDVCEALVYGCDQCVEVRVTRDQIEQVRRNLQKLREPGMLIARGLALLDEAALETVEQLDEGKGLVVAGRSAIGLAAFFRDNAVSLAGKHPFTEQRLATLESLGAWILRHVTPDGAAAVKPVEPTVAEQRRDMLWAEVRRRHASMRLGGFKVYGDRYNDHVPPLNSRVSSRRGADNDDDPPAPAPAPDPQPARPV